MIWLVVRRTWPIWHLPAATDPSQWSPLSKDPSVGIGASKIYNSCLRTTTKSASRNIKVTSGRSRGQLSLLCKTDVGQKGWLRRGMSRALAPTRILGDRLLRRHKPAVRAGLQQQMLSELLSLQSQILDRIAHDAVLVLSIVRLRFVRTRPPKL